LSGKEYVKLIQGRATSDHIEAVRKACSDLSRAGNNDPGSIRYTIYQAKDDPALFTVFGRWHTVVDFDRYIASDYHQKFMEVIPEGGWAMPPKAIILEEL